MFQITQEENLNYDRNKDMETENCIRNNNEMFNPYGRSGLSRHQGRNETDTLITTREAETTTKSFKNETPDETKINKTILKQIPIIAINKLQQIFNHCFFNKQLPEKITDSHDQTNPKPNTDHTKPVN